MARRDNHLERLGEVPLFSACSKKDLGVIAKASDRIDVKEGRRLVEQGATGREFFLILDGEAVVERDGKEVARLKEGKYFGELSLLDRGPRSATVVAASDMRLLVLGQREFTGLLDSVPGLASKVLTTMARRLIDADTNAHTH